MNKSQNTTTKRREKAQGMLEFALTLPLLLVLVYGIIEAGRLLFLYSAALTSSREAARYGSAAGELSPGGVTTRYQDCAGIRAAAMRIGGLAGIQNGNVTILYDEGPGTASIAHCNNSFTITDSSIPELRLGDRVEVRVTVTYRPLISMVGFSPFPITTVTRRTILKDVQIEGTPPSPTTPRVYFVMASQNRGEGDGDVVVRVQLSAATSNAVVVPYTLAGSATEGAGEDYTITPSQVTITPGETYADILIHVNDDDMDEDDETVLIAMGTPTHADKDAPDVHTATIADNDDPPRVYFSHSSQSQPEDQDLYINLALSAASSRPITVNYSVAGTASHGADYSIASSSVTIPAGSSSISIVAVVNDDDMDEDDETVVVSIGDVVNATRDHPDVHTATIVDNDLPPIVSFTWAEQSALENDGHLVVQLELSAASSKEVTVPFTVGGSATPGSDYTLAVAPVTISAGDLTGKIGLSILEDSDPLEGDETIVLTLATPTNATKGPPDVHTVTITDVPVIPEVSFAISSQSKAEAAGGAMLSVTVKLSAATSKDVTVPFSLGGTALKNLDYTISSSPVVIPAGSARATILIDILDDSLDEGSETVVVTLGAPTNATLGSPSVHTATIADNDDPPVVSFALASQTQGEGVGSFTVSIRLSLVSGLPVTVPFTLSGSASQGVDYTITASPITIPAGSPGASLTVAVIDDDDLEPQEEILLTLGAPANATLGTPDTHTANITDNEPVCPSPDSLPFFGGGSESNKLAWTLQSPNPLVPVNLLAVTIRWPSGSGTDVTAITFGDPLYAGNAQPPYLAVNSPTPLWSGAFSTRQIIFKFSKAPKSVPGDFYQLTATFEGCPPVSGIIPSD